MAEFYEEEIKTSIRQLLSIDTRHCVNVGDDLFFRQGLFHERFENPARCPRCLSSFHAQDTPSQEDQKSGVLVIRPKKYNSFRSPRASLQNLRVNVFFVIIFFLIKKNKHCFSSSKEYVKLFQILQYCILRRA